MVVEYAFRLYISYHFSQSGFSDVGILEQVLIYYYLETTVRVFREPPRQTTGSRIPPVLFFQECPPLMWPTICTAWPRHRRVSADCNPRVWVVTTTMGVLNHGVSVHMAGIAG